MIGTFIMKELMKYSNAKSSHFRGDFMRRRSRHAPKNFGILTGKHQ